MRGFSLLSVGGLLLFCSMITGCAAKNLNKNIPLAALGAKDRASDFANVFCTLVGTEKRPDGSS
jgi:hypothetical protein